MIPIKIADYIIKFLLILALLLIATRVHGCEIYNHDTDKCESWNEQNLTLNMDLKEFFNNSYF